MAFSEKKMRKGDILQEIMKKKKAKNYLSNLVQALLFSSAYWRADGSITKNETLLGKLEERLGRKNIKY